LRTIIALAGKRTPVESSWPSNQGALTGGEAPKGARQVSAARHGPRFAPIQPGEVNYLLTLAALAGIGVSAAYILPDSILPDVIEWDELRTGRRQEGVYYGIRTLIRKLTGALIIFITFQVLGWSGYQAPPDNVIQFTQPDSALFMIRMMVSFLGAGILVGTILLAWSYPLSREKYERIQKLLTIKRNKKTYTFLYVILQ
jgi:GPH family glycoside/pentoside/hexuronide:cation symporter